MRLVQSGIANNFGLVGKNIRRYLATTALTATGLMAIATPALADNWTDHVASEGSISIDTTKPNTTNIKQNTDFVKVHGDGDINAGWTVNVAQPSNNSKYVLYDIENDPTKIMGNLNANGRIYIFDQNGVIFGQGSQVNVGGIVTSTGYISDSNIKADKHVFENVGGAGEIVNDGSITVSEGGLAAFVAPAVRNNGVINAKAGSVALASGNKVTLDLYGDDLVNIEVDGALENAIVENKGTISASGGTVALTVAAAKNAVDSVVNMDGIIDVSSVSVKGGKIIVNGGKKGAVKISGKLDASGQGGGDISIKGENVLVTSGADLDASAKQNGNGGSLRIWGDNNSYFFGNAAARGGSVSGDGGFVEVSAGNSVAYAGLVDTSAANGKTGRFLIDPQHVVLGTIDPSVMIANIGIDALLGGAFPILVVDQKALANTLHTTDVDLWATETISTAEKINISEYNYTTSQTTLKPFPAGCGAICQALWPLNPGNYVTTVTNHNGITSHDLTLAAPTVNLKHDITLGTGKLLVQDLAAGISPLGLGLLPAPHDIVVNELNLDGRIYKRANLADASFTTLADDAQLFTTADKINVLSNKALIQQGVHFADNAGGATVTVGDGTYVENVVIDKSLTLLSKNGRAKTKIQGIANDGEEAAVQIENNTNNLQIGDIGKGFTIVGFENGAAASETAAVYLRGNHNNIKIIGNDVVANGDNGLLTLWGGIVSNVTIDNNIFSGTSYEGSLAGTGGYFVAENVPRPLVYFGNAPTKSNIIFTNNDITGRTGGLDINGNQSGNISVNIDATGATITGNKFMGSTASSMVNEHGSLRVRGTDTLISGNTFYATGLTGNNVYHIYATAGAYATGRGQSNVMDLWEDNTFVGRATVTDSDVFASYDHIGVGIQNAVDASTMTGANAYVNGGATYKESVLVNKAVYLHGANAGKAGYDSTRGPESIVSPNSPGFKVVTAGATVDGFLITGASGPDGYGVWVDKVGGVKVKNNIIDTVSQNGVFADTATGVEITDNEIDNTGSHGIDVKDSGAARILRNYIGLNGADFSIKGDGVRLKDSDGSWVNNNRITNTKSTAQRIGSGIQSISSDKVEMVENEIWDTDWDGIRVDKGDQLLIKKNNIDDAVRTGIYLGAVTKTDLIDNDIDTVGRYGIHADAGDKVKLDNNWIDGTGLHGIYAYKTKNLTVENNDVGNTSALPGNIKNHGIYLDQTKNALVQKNILQYAAWDGINAYKAEGAKITDNNIRYVGGNGIELLESFELTGTPGSLEVSLNKVNDTGSHGILIDKSLKAQVLTNYIGLLGAAFNIKGDGIQLNEAHGAQVKFNDIRYTKSTAHNIGSGIQSIKSNDIYLYDNDTRDTDWDGIRVEKGEAIVIEKNDIDRAKRTGIYTTATTGTATIYNNDIDVAGNYGIHVNAGNIVNIDKNDVDKVNLDGIFARKVKDLLIQYNNVGEAFGSYINGDGIHVESSNYADIYDNDVTKAKGHGIFVDTSDYVDISYNDIWKVIKDGINVKDGRNVDIWENEIDDAGEDGIDVQSNNYADIWKNYIDGTKQDGIKVSSSDFADIDKNEITDAGNDGISVYGGKFADIRGNKIYGKDGTFGVGDDGAKRDGIHVVGNFGVDIIGNEILGGDGVFLGVGGAGAGRNGIFVRNSGFADIIGNQILAGSPGLLALGGAGAGKDGISVRNTYGADIALNVIAGVLDDGIQVVKSTGTNIFLNAIGLTGDDGIALRKADRTDIGFNLIGLTGGDGIDIRRSDKVDVFGNLILYTAGDGIYARRSDDLDVGFNFISNAGDDGIDVEKSDRVNVFANFVRYAKNSGVEVSGSDDVFVGYNLLSNNKTGFFAQGARNGNIEVSGNVFYNNTTGAHFQSGIIDLTGPGNYFFNGRVGMYFEDVTTDPSKPVLSLVRAGGVGHTYDGTGYDTYPTVPFNPTHFGGTIGQQHFYMPAGGSQFVVVEDGTFVDPGTGEAIWLDASESSYWFPLESAWFTPSIDGTTPDRELFLEDKFTHRMDFDNRGIFFFYPVPVPPGPAAGGDQPTIQQSLIFNRFNTFNGDATGLNVQIASLPSVGGGAPTTPAALNQITTFAGNGGGNPSELNAIETAAGGNDQSSAGQLNAIETASGGENQSCWGNAVAAAGAGQVVNVVYTGGVSANLNQAAACGTGF